MSLRVSQEGGKQADAFSTDRVDNLARNGRRQDIPCALLGPREIKLLKLRRGELSRSLPERSTAAASNAAHGTFP